MFNLLRLIWTVFTISTCSVKEDGEWSCAEYCLPGETTACDPTFSDLSKSSMSTLLKYQTEFIDFTNGYYRNYDNPRIKRMLTVDFLQMIYFIEVDLITQREIPIKEIEWITERLMASHTRFKSLATQPIDTELSPMCQGVYYTLQFALKDLDLNMSARIH